MVEMDKPENEWKSFSVDDGEEMSLLDILWLNDHLAKCFDRESTNYECLARMFGIDDRPKSKVTEIAKDLGIAPGEVRTHLRNCKTRFYNYLTSQNIGIDDF